MNPETSGAEVAPYHDYAHHILSSGLGSPIPVKTGSKFPPLEGLTGSSGLDLSGPDVEEYRESHGRNNVAIRLARDVIGLDFDYHKDHAATAGARAAIEDRGSLPATWRTTRRGAGDLSGICLYRLPDGADESTLTDPPPAQGRAHSHIETIRWSHRYAMTVGSVVDGKVYQVVAPDGTIQDGLPSKDRLPVLDWPVIEYLTRRQPRLTVVEDAPEAGELADSQRNFLLVGLEKTLARLDVMREKAKPGGVGYDGEDWDQTTFNVACRAIEIGNALGTDRGELLQQIRDRAPRDEGFDDARIEDKIRSAVQTIGDEKASVPPPRGADPFGGTESGEEPARAQAIDLVGSLTDSDYGLALCEYYPNRFKNVVDMGVYMWDGKRYKSSKEAALIGLSDVFAREVAEQAARRGDRALLKTALGRMQTSKIRAAVTLAMSRDEILTPHEQLDAHPYLLNVDNGTLDLSGPEPVLHPHNPDDLMTKVCKASWTPGVDRTFWEDFLAGILPDREERDFLKRVIGSSLIGEVKEHIFPILEGEGRNGKGTFYEAVRKALGDYAVIIDPSMLMANEKGREAGEEVMVLKGARLAIGSETNQGRALDEATMKRLTGGDSISARKHYKSPVEWEPTHQLLYVTNHLPKVKGDDEATWARMKVIHFDVVVPKEERDTELPKKLTLHLDAILAWAVEGYYEWRRGGLSEPEGVMKATSGYRFESSPIERFIAEDCLVSPAASATTGEIHAAYTRWAIRGNEERVSDKALTKRLARLGYEKKRTNRGATWMGVSPFVTIEE